MAAKKGHCAYAYYIRDTLYCCVLEEQGAQWTFCKHQYYCRQTKRHELADGADKCNLTQCKATGNSKHGTESEGG